MSIDVIQRLPVQYKFEMRRCTKATYTKVKRLRTQKIPVSRSKLSNTFGSSTVLSVQQRHRRQNVMRIKLNTSTVLLYYYKGYQEATLLWQHSNYHDARVCACVCAGAEVHSIAILYR